MAAPKSFVFAGSTYGEPWYTLGEVTARALAPLGYEVTVETRSASTENPRWVARGDAFLGGSMPSFVMWAMNGKYDYVGEKFPEFQAIALVHRPSWLGVAVTAESRIRSLDQVREEKIPVRVLAGGWDNCNTVLPQRTFAHYGLTREAIESWGGVFHRTGANHAIVHERDFDIIMGDVYLGYTVVSRYWMEASILMNLRFLDLDEALVGELSKEPAVEPGMIPHGLMRGLTRDVRSVARPHLMIYGTAAVPEELAYQLAKGLDERRTDFLQTRTHMAYDSSIVAHTPIPLNPGAERYYREVGYLK